MSTPLHYLSVRELSRLIRSRDLSPIELLDHYLVRADTLDPELNAFRLISGNRAGARARLAEAALARGDTVSPLHGMPYAVKDLIDVKGLPTTAGCSLLADNIANADAAVVERLDGAGMVLMGKTNTVQFAYGGAGVNHDHGTPRNPWSSDHYLPGGSSSGSAVAVAAGLVPAALGTDTGGSVRIPAALCGITGLKTTVGQVSRAGVYPLSKSLDSVGALCRTVEDAALLYTAMAGSDPRDDSTRGREPRDVLESLSAGVKGMRIAFAEGTLWDDVDPEVAAAVRAAGTALAELGAQVESIEFREAERAKALNPKGLVIAAEAYAVNRHWVDHHRDELDPIVGTRLVAGRSVTAADYLEAAESWDQLRAEAAGAFQRWDALLCPTTPVPAKPVATADQDLKTYLKYNLLYLRNTTVGNILGFCGLSVPCGFTSEGLPVGLMIYGVGFSEHRILRIGHAFQEATDWHRRVPPLD
jgi:aspartyl-tRNA(Asn)/glutamyl-tRNA(Gln) amidotransferase subunit A